MKWSMKAQVSQDWLLYCTGLTTLHRADYALVKPCLPWMPLRPALCAIGACSFVALVPFVSNGTWAISQDSLSVQTLLQGFLWKVGITGWVLEQQEAKEIWEIVQFNHHVLVHVLNFLLVLMAQCYSPEKKRPTKHALHILSEVATVGFRMHSYMRILGIK